MGSWLYLSSTKITRGSHCILYSVIHRSHFILTNEKSNKPENEQIFLDTQEDAETHYLPGQKPKSWHNHRNQHSGWKTWTRTELEAQHGEVWETKTTLGLSQWRGGMTQFCDFYFLEFCWVLTVIIRKNKDCISGRQMGKGIILKQIYIFCSF